MRNFFISSLAKFIDVLTWDTNNEHFTCSKIVEMWTWQGYQGFTAVHCGKCKRDANVIHGRPGFFCDGCGHYNCQSWNYCKIPHDNPSYGPSQMLIHFAHVLAELKNPTHWRTRHMHYNRKLGSSYKDRV